jgi:putative MATE family efflux protein
MVEPKCPSDGPDEAKETDRLLVVRGTDTEWDDMHRAAADEAPPPSTGRKILDLAVPAAAALLVDPLMTLTDTAMVGRYSGDGAYPLAGMGSASALLTFSFYLFNFLCTATTPLVARKRAEGDEIGARAVGGQALSLALVLGILLALTLTGFQQPLLRAMGTGITGQDANRYAVQFMSVRALAAPAILSIEASTGVLRGYLDTKTPIVILVAANLLNLLLDVVLIAGFGLGPLGAAVATTTAEWISAGLFLGVLAGGLPSASGSVKQRDGRTTLSVVPLLSVPSWQDVQPLVVASGSIFCRALVLQLFFSAAAVMAARGHVAPTPGSSASPPPPASVAAHQIGIQLWLLCSFFCDSLAAASQGLVADALGRDDPDDVMDVSKTVFLYSSVLGLFLAAVLQAGTSMGWLLDVFTHDAPTRTILSEILPLVVVAQPVNALVFAADGVLQGASEFPYQAKSMALSGLVAVGSFVALESAAAGQDVNTLVHIWWALLVLQLGRGLTSLWKLVDPRGPIDLLSSKSPS